MTNREKAIKYIEERDDDFFSDIIVLGHDFMTHQWLEVFPDGDVNKTEEVDNNTSHWIDYPNKEVECIYEICSESAEPCNCDLCTEYRDYEDMSKDDFVRQYSEESWDYWHKHTYEESLLDYSHENDVYESDIKDEIIKNIKNIYHGYFDDEE